MRIVIFPIMCHLPRGDKKNSLLTSWNKKVKFCKLWSWITEASKPFELALLIKVDCTPFLRSTIFSTVIIDAVNSFKQDCAICDIQPIKLVVHIVRLNHLSLFGHLNKVNQVR